MLYIHITYKDSIFVHITYLMIAKICVYGAIRFMTSRKCSRCVLVGASIPNSSMVVVLS